MTIEQIDHEPSLRDLLDLAGSTQGTKKRGLTPATVETYDETTQTAWCVPAVHVNIQGTVLQQPKVKARVIFPQGAGGSFSLTFPLEEGDTVWLMPAEMDISRWLNNSVRNEAPPTSRGWNLIDAIAIPGGPPLPESLGKTQVAPDAITLNGDKVYLGSSAPPHAIALGDYNDTNWAAITTWYKLLVVWAAAQTPPLTVPPSPGAFLSTSSLIVKADG